MVLLPFRSPEIATFRFFSSLMIFSGVHVWTADTPTKEQRAAWIANLDKISARKPSVVVPGHMAPGVAVDLSAVEGERRPAADDDVHLLVAGSLRVLLDDRVSGLAGVRVRPEGADPDCDRAHHQILQDPPINRHPERSEAKSRGLFRLREHKNRSLHFAALRSG